MTDDRASLEGERELVRLVDCPTGLFVFEGQYGFRSEYADDAYCLESGEYFWGGTSNRNTRNALMVEPITLKELAADRENERRANNWLLDRLAARTPEPSARGEADGRNHYWEASGGRINLVCSQCGLSVRDDDPLVSSPCFSGSVPPSAAEIAGRLSEAQRRAIGREAWISSDRKLCCAGTTATIRDLQRLGLANSIYHLTPLGLAVRTHLQGTSHADR